MSTTGAAPQPARPAPAHSSQEQASELRSGNQSKFVSLLFALLVFLFCAWSLSLPLFPTQDGPMHKYYVHVIASLLSHSRAYGVYMIRRPPPPYAIHYTLLLGFTRFLSIDMAEKVLVVIILIVTAYGFRYCARSLGPSGDLLSLCMVPLVLHWSLMMGFLNYSLAVGLFFLAAGLWVRASAGRVGLWLPFLGVVVVLTATHPVPLLLLIAFCALDLAIALYQACAHAKEARAHAAGVRAGLSLRNYRWQFLGLIAAALSFLYPLASADRARSMQNLHATALHPSTVLTCLALGGICPFDTRAINPLIVGYKLGLYAILIGGLLLAASGFRDRWRGRQLRSSDTMLFGSIALLIAIPILPEQMNGSDFFAQRLMIFAWLGAVAAASGFSQSGRLRRIAPAFAVLLTALTLLPAEIFIRPVAEQLAALEAQPLPSHVQGLAILDPAMLPAVRKRDQLGFNPYLWSGVLPFLHADDVMLNSPWLELTIMPLRAVPQSSLMVNETSSPEEAERLINGNINLAVLGPEIRDPLLRSTKLIVLVATPPDVESALERRGDFLTGVSRTGQTACVSHGWYLVCTF